MPAKENTAMDRSSSVVSRVAGDADSQLVVSRVAGDADSQLTPTAK
jgi:hypothetical protein